MKTGPILIIDDDADDKEILEEVIRELDEDNKLVWLKDCIEAWDYLRAMAIQPFIIFCDVNLPKMSGIEFKQQIDADEQLRKKSIPFIFYSTSIEKDIVNEAYLQLTVQGFFQKQDNYQAMKQMVKVILDYWRLSKHPNTLL